jgi:hypothetical protein
VQSQGPAAQPKAHGSGRWLGGLTSQDCCSRAHPSGLRLQGVALLWVADIQGGAPRRPSGCGVEGADGLGAACVIAGARAHVPLVHQALRSEDTGAGWGLVAWTAGGALHRCRPLTSSTSMAASLLRPGAAELADTAGRASSTLRSCSARAAGRQEAVARLPVPCPAAARGAPAP